MQASSFHCFSGIALLRESSQCFTLNPYRLPVVEKNCSQLLIEIDGRLIPRKHFPAQRSASFAQSHRRNFSNHCFPDSLISELGADINICEK